MSTEPQLAATAQAPERNWLPMVIAAVVVIAIAAGIVVALERGKPAPTITPISAAPDPYATSMPITNLAMSESSNLSGGKLTYLDGHIQNQGGRTVTSITVQVLYRDFAHEVVNNYTQPFTIIRMRDPYIDVGPISAAPLAPGAEADFRLIFDGVKSDWDGALPEVRLIHIDTK